jgi:hypothetical protein
MDVDKKQAVAKPGSAPAKRARGKQELDEASNPGKESDKVESKNKAHTPNADDDEQPAVGASKRSRDTSDANDNSTGTLISN